MKSTRLITLIESDMMSSLIEAGRVDGVSTAEIVRRAITEYLRSRREPRAVDPMLIAQLGRILLESATWKGELDVKSAARCAVDLRKQADSDDVAIIAATVFADPEVFKVLRGDLKAAIEAAREINSAYGVVPEQTEDEKRVAEQRAAEEHADFLKELGLDPSDCPDPKTGADNK